MGCLDDEKALQEHVPKVLYTEPYNHQALYFRLVLFSIGVWEYGETPVGGLAAGIESAPHNHGLIARIAGHHALNLLSAAV